MPHPLFTFLTAVLLAVAMAMVDDRTPRQRLLAAGRVLLICAVVTVGGGWLMRLIHG
jgi:hypothetical protein